MDNYNSKHDNKENIPKVTNSTINKDSNYKVKAKKKNLLSRFDYLKGKKARNMYESSEELFDTSNFYNDPCDLADLEDMKGFDDTNSF